MNIQQPKIDLKNGFELYLEGIKVEFLSMTISEVEGGIPAASITFPSNRGALRLLPGTIVQIFGRYHRSKKTLILFEGELTAVNFQKTESSKVVVIKAISLLGSMIKAKFRPSDAILTAERKAADGIQGSTYVLYNNKESIGPQTSEGIKDVVAEKETTMVGTSNQIGISAVFGLTDDFRRLLAEGTPGGRGDFIPMIQQFNSIFEHNDLFYGLKSLAYKFGRTVFASPNPNLLNKIKIDLFFEAFNDLKSTGISDIFSERPYTLMQVLTEFQRYLHYSLISPAAFTACKPFYLKENVTDLEPLRMIYMPRIESGPPALCNIFFPEQTSSFTYSREMMSEPTRIVGKATVSLLNEFNANIDYSPCAVYPSLKFDSEKAVGNFTNEETYRGINYKVITYSNLHSDLLNKLKSTYHDGKNTGKGNSIVAKDMESGQIGSLIRPFAYMDFLDLKYKNRQTAVTSEWNPYRMVGLPAMILDNDGTSIVGVILSLETSISAQGIATTRATLRNTRIVFDEEFEKTIFSSEPGTESSGNEKYVIHDLTNDGMMSTNELLYDQALYNFENIGKDVYTYILHGMLNKNKGFLSAKNAFGIFGYTEDRLDGDDNDHSRLDNSVLHYLPRKNGEYTFIIPDQYLKKTELKNTYLLYKAISELRKAYERSKYKSSSRGEEKEFDMPQAYDYMEAINRRNILTKEEYFAFIGAAPERTLQIEDAHDAKVIFQGGAQELREEILERINSQYVNVITAVNADLTSVKTKIRLWEQKLADLIPTGYTPLTITQEIIAKKYQKDPFKGKYNKRQETEIVKDEFAEIQKLIDQLQGYKTKKESLESSNSEVTTITKEKEMYKPYNMTRRMHVVLALKDQSDLLIDNNKSKLTVTK